MEEPPSVRKKQLAKQKQKEKGKIYSQKHIRIKQDQLEKTNDNIRHSSTEEPDYKNSNF